ncbi:MAG: sigma-54-dependent Fis family transcriptional regulator [Bryobacterales bacterium]|nr:sigma-54-dependent Fis family transcriptional regulator [Bryobacterales bacterium]
MFFMQTLLVVDDEAAARFALKRAFQAQYEVLEAEAVEGARHAIRSGNPQVVLLDYTLPGEDGMVLLKELNQGLHSPAVIMITAYGSERIAVDAMKNGAFDYLPKPYDLEELRLVVERAFEHQALRRELQDLRDRLAGEGQFGRMVGDSPAMREVFLMAERVAQTDLPVLILGESGTGKDLLAQEIHARSPRARGRLVALNCAALPEHLVESELFGYEKGAFTGAMGARPGKFELATGGTLFLDEIGDMTPATQAKILRAAETGMVERLGASRPTQVDVRIVAATNQDLETAIRQGRFRQDLYFRLAGMTLYLPPLRQRREDIPLLVESFWSDLQRKYKREGPELTREAMVLLGGGDWPGNVRQLRSAVERLFVLARSERVTAADVKMAAEPLPFGAAKSEPYLEAADFREARKLFEIEYLTRKLREHGGNVTRTAAAIGLERQSLQEKIRQLGISRD